MRGALVKLEGIDKGSIKTDTNLFTASFHVEEGTEYKAELAKLAEGNDHLADFELIDQGS